MYECCCSREKREKGLEMKSFPEMKPIKSPRRTWGCSPSWTRGHSRRRGRPRYSITQRWSHYAPISQPTHHGSSTARRHATPPSSKPLGTFPRSLILSSVLAPSYSRAQPRHSITTLICRLSSLQTVCKL